MPEKKPSLINAFLSYQAALSKVIRNIVPPADVEDIVQETFIRAHEAEVNKRLEYPKAFMHKTAMNLALNFIAKKEHSSTSKIEDIPDLEVYINDQYEFDGHESKEKFRLFCAAVRELPLQCRKAFIMKRVFGYSTKEVSSVLGVSQSTAEKHIAKGVLRCADYLQDSGYPVNKRVKHKPVDRNKGKA